MDKTEENASLQDLYDIIDKSRKCNVRLSEDVINQINAAEENIIRNDILPALSKDIEPRLNTIKRDLVLVVEYHPGKPISVALSRKTSIRMITGAKTIIQHPTKVGEPVSGGSSIPKQNESNRKVINHTRGLKVTFPDGVVICNNNAIETFKDVLRHIGLQRIHDLGIMHSGYNLVSHEMRPVERGKTWQHKVENWYIYSNTRNSDKIKDLQFISDKFHLSHKVEEEKPEKIGI